MKGMQKISRGKGFRGALNYAQDRDSPAEERGQLIGGNMSGQDAKTLAKEFGLSRALRPDIQKPVWHNALRLPMGERIEPDKFARIADDYMERMGFTDLHQRCYWLHDDKDGQHIHIVASRVSLDGSVYLGKNENLKSTKLISKLEEVHGLTITPSVHLDDGRVVMPDKATLSKGEIDMVTRQIDEALSFGPIQPHILDDLEPPKQKLQRIIDEAKIDRPTAVQFAERLEAAGVTPVANLASTGKLNGFSFEIDGIAFKGSQLGKAYGWGQLSKDVTYEQTTDREGLELFSAARRRDQERARVTAGDRDNAAAVTDAEEPRQSSESVGATGSGVGIVNGGEQSGDTNSGERGHKSLKATRAGDAETGQINKIGGSNIPSIAKIRSGIEKGDTPESLASRFVYKPADSGAYDRLLDLAATSVRNSNHEVKHKAWMQQHESLRAPAYRITLTSRREHLKTYNMGKGKGEGGAEKTYSAQDVAGMLPSLARQNARGYDIYITPIDPEHHYLVIDDMTAKGVERLKRSGFAPTLIQTSSKDNQQCIVKVPRHHNQKDEQKLANSLVQYFNRELGDPDFSGVIHPFRLAAFSNKKDGRGDFFTQILEGQHQLCGRTAQSMDEMRAKIEEESKKAVAKLDEKAKDIRVDAIYKDGGGTNQDQLCRAAYQSVFKLVEQAGWQLDMSKVDFRVAKLLLRDGLSDGAVESLLIAHSPSLHERHSNEADYARRTVDAAALELSVEGRQAERAVPDDFDYEQEERTASIRPKM